jgi:hypothetical protein
MAKTFLPWLPFMLGVALVVIQWRLRTLQLEWSRALDTWDGSERRSELQGVLWLEGPEGKLLTRKLPVRMKEISPNRWRNIKTILFPEYLGPTTEVHAVVFVQRNGYRDSIGLQPLMVLNTHDVVRFGPGQLHFDVVPGTASEAQERGV